jgi:hypothetical protein
MQQFFESLLRFLHQGIDAIFHFIRLVWTWSAGEISTLAKVPWHDWPLWKEILLVFIAGGVVYALYKVAMELWVAGEKILAGFAALLVVLIRTLPSMLMAGLIALGGVWVLNNVDLSDVHMPAFISQR